MKKNYHVTNSGIEKKLVFIDRKDVDRFTKLLQYYQFKNPPTRFSFRKRQAASEEKPLLPLVTILCYIQMPDHFHLLLEEAEDGNVSKFLSLVTNSYTKYFNARYKRSGPLFKGIFKREIIATTDHLIKTSVLIHGEPVTKGIVENVKKFPFSSFPEYLGEKEGFCSKETILSHFSSEQDYYESVVNTLEQKQIANFLH